MKVLKGSYFQKGPLSLVLRYSNLLSGIRELLVTGASSRQIQKFSSEKFSDMKLDSLTDSEQYDKEIPITILLRQFTYLKSSH